MWEVNDEHKATGQRGQSRMYDEDRIAWMVFTHLVSVFRWEVLRVEPGLILLQQPRGEWLREFRRVP